MIIIYISDVGVPKSKAITDGRSVTVGLGFSVTWSNVVVRLPRPMEGKGGRDESHFKFFGEPPVPPLTAGVVRTLIIVLLPYIILVF